MKIMTAVLVSFICIQLFACSKESEVEPPNHTIESVKDMKLKITVGSKTASAVLYDNPTTRDFVAQLPLTVDMEDFAGKEKIFYPANKLSTSELKAVSDPIIGDINVYAPWGNIAVFYSSYSDSIDLIRIGRITEGIDAFNVPGKLTKVTYELVK